jgi:radical SAM protein with 4Fe4S-binding SPASM domain
MNPSGKKCTEAHPSPPLSIEGLWSIVLIELTSHCNFSCSFCPIDSMGRKKTTMKRELWKKILDELGEKKMARTVFFHVLGEPLAHNDLFDAIAFANDRGLSVSLYTNGALLDERRSSALLEVMKKGRIVLSMQEIDPDSFDQRSHGNLTWEEYITRLQDFVHKAEKREKDIPIQIHCMTDIRSLRWNFPAIFREKRRVQAVYDLWKTELGIEESKNINIFDPTASYPLGKNSSFYIKHAGNWDNQLIGDEFQVIPKKRGHCALMTDTFAILSDGTCTYCCNDYEGELKLGNANDESLEAIYFGEKAAGIREAEKREEFIEKRCQMCRGILVSKKNGKPVRSWMSPSDIYIFKEHLQRYGMRSSVRKIMERILKNM